MTTQSPRHRSSWRAWNASSDSGRTPFSASPGLCGKKRKSSLTLRFLSSAGYVSQFLTSDSIFEARENSLMGSMK